MEGQTQLELQAPVAVEQSGSCTNRKSYNMHLSQMVHPPTTEVAAVCCTFDGCVCPVYVHVLPSCAPKLRMLLPGWSGGIKRRSPTWQVPFVAPDALSQRDLVEGQMHDELQPQEAVEQRGSCRGGEGTGRDAR